MARTEEIADTVDNTIIAKIVVTYTETSYLKLKQTNRNVSHF